MKTIGLLGGMSWKSSLDYYRIINELVSKRLGGWHSAKLIMNSVDFDEIDLEHATDSWKKSDKILFDAVKSLQKAGADFIIIGANTAHVLFDEFEKRINIPILHIADATGNRIQSKGLTKVGLLGTKHTMKKNFYKERLENKYDIEVVVPKEEEIEPVNEAINKVILGDKFQDEKKRLLAVAKDLSKNVEALVLACTELPMLIKPENSPVPLFDTMRIHAEEAVEYALID